MATTEQEAFEKRLFKVARELNISTDRVVEYLEEHDYDDALTGSGFNASIVDEEAYLVLRDEFADDAEAAARIRELRSEEEGGTERDEVATLDEEQEAEPDISEEEVAPATGSSDGEGPSEEEVADQPEDAEVSEPVGSTEAPADAAAPTAEADVGADAPTEDDHPVAEGESTSEAEDVSDAETPPEAGEAHPDAEGDAVAETADTEAEAPSADETETADATAETAEPASEADAVDSAPTDEAPVAEASGDDDPVDDEAPSESGEAHADGAGDAVAETPDTEAEAPSTDEAEAPDADEPAVAEPEPADATAEAPADEPSDAETEADEASADAADAKADADGEEPDADEESGTLKANRYRLSGTQVVDKVDVNKFQRPKRKRKRKDKDDEDDSKDKKKQQKDKKQKKKSKKKGQKKGRDKDLDEEDVEQTIQETLQELEQGASRERQRRRRRRRKRHEEERKRRRERRKEQEDVIELTEYVTTGELANLMGEPVSDVIDTLFEAGMMVSINQRLDRETIEFVVDEYEMEAQFVDEFGEGAVEIEEDDPEDLEPRAPVVTVMGHVDHGKTSLLDYIRNANVVAGEEGGITQHIGAHHVELTDHEGEAITFLDTPGHEAFTAMRARGAKATDIVILVVAADDSVMPQTIEAINHAQAADVPILVAINKMDKREADAERVRAELAEHNVLVEEYGGDVQSSEVSAETGDGINDLLEKVVLQSEIMELQANPNREASGVVIESRLEKGRGNVITVLVQNGSLEVGDPFIAGQHSGSVRAMFDERDNRIETVGPSQPALVLGCDGSPEVGDQFVVMDSEGEARDLAQERQRIHREQELRRKSQVSLDQVSRRMAEGEFHELNLIVKADVGGSVEALSDALLKLKTDEVAVNIIHSGVGAITESDVMLARASDAIILGFQVRPTSGARSAADQEEVDIRTYSVIYSAIEDVRDALEGLLSPERREEMKGRAEVRDTFSVPDVGTVAGCYVTEGTINRNHQIRVVRDGVVVYEGDISSLKRFDDDVKEVQNGYECGLSIENFDDVKVDDELESYVVVEEKRTLEV
jgi:translation initiation factor IF-2